MIPERYGTTTISESEVDVMFQALADSTRRDILRRCVGETPSMSRLADAYEMSFTAVQKHVLVLERAGLVTRERRGREQLVGTDLARIHQARQALDKLETDWRGRIDRMANLLDEVSQETTTHTMGEEQ